jgi:hypothetical protein
MVVGMSAQGDGKTGRLVFQRYITSDEIAGEPGRRLKALETAANNRGLNQDELEELRHIVEAHSEGQFLEGPEFTKLGVTNPEQFLANFRDLEQEAEYAYQHAFFLEAVSLRLLALDFMLRAYVVHRTGEAIEPYSQQDRKSFGFLIGQAERNDLPEDLVNDLRAFNRARNAGIHHFLLGRTSYQRIGDAYREADFLFERIIGAMALPPMKSK